MDVFLPFAHKIFVYVKDNLIFLHQDSKSFSWDDDSSPEREPSPPMPTIPPPPPPVVDDDPTWPEDVQDFLSQNVLEDIEDMTPYAVALFDYFTDHEEDLCFSVSFFLFYSPLSSV